MTATAPTSRFPRPNFFRRPLRDLWHLHPPVVLLVRAPRDVCLNTLALAATPSQQRLHLRELFVEGRRYFVQPHRDGFRLTSNSQILWSRRRRTAFASTLFGTLAPLDDDVTSVRLHARANTLYMLRGLFIPAWMSAILVFMPWDRLAIAGTIALLFALAWLGHRLNAALQASEMVFFVQKALADLPTADVPELAASGADVVAQPNRDFRDQWQRFYDEVTNNEG